MEALIIRNSRKKAARLYTTWPPFSIAFNLLIGRLFKYFSPKSA